jgi:hypothetical protein
MKLHIILFDVLIGLPGGGLIFMGMLMFNAVITLLFPTGPVVMFVLLCFTSLVVGLLSRLMRPYHGLGTAIASGIVAALLILFLRQTPPAAPGSSLVFGPAGMAVAIIFTILGAWIYPKLRRQPLHPARDLKAIRK